MRLPYIQFVGVLLLALLELPSTWAQGSTRDAARQKSSLTKLEIAVVTSVRVVEERGVPAVEILSTLPPVPSIQFLNSPPRLVIDLLHSRVGLPNKRIDLQQIDVQQKNIVAIRAEQYQEDPPIVRIVLDLAAPYGYTWDEADNRLMVRLKAPEDVNAAKDSHVRPPAVLSLAPRAAAVVPTGAGEVTFGGKQIAPGSSLATSSDTAVLRLTRGGEIRICPGTTVSVTPSKNTKDLMLGMNTGALETHYALATSADTVLTPDFRILFAGPGEFDFAISADPHGNTCVRGLAGNTSSVIVSELMGNRIYQVKATEQAVFRSGQIDKVDNNVPLECGCPPPTPVMRTTTSQTGSETSANDKITDGDAKSRLGAQKDNSAQMMGTADAAAGKEVNQTLSNGPETHPLPPSQPNDIHIQVDAPFVFRGKNAAPPAPMGEAAGLPVMEAAARPDQPAIQIQPPPTAAQSPASQPVSAPRRLLRRVKGFFGAIFR